MRDDLESDEAELEARSLLAPTKEQVAFKGSVAQTATIRSSTVPPLRRKRCVIATAAGLLLLICFAAPFVLRRGARMFYNKAVMHYSWKQALVDNADPRCMPKEFTEFVSKNLAETCTRLNRAGVDYWLDKGTLLAVLREPGQSIFKHDSDADLVYMERDHAKMVGALKDGGAGEFFRQYDEDYGGFGRRDPPYATLIDLDAAAFTEETSARTEFGRKSLAINKDVAFYMPSIIFPLRKLGGKGKLAHCSIPNIPFAYYEDRDWSTGFGPRMVQNFLQISDLDLRPCVPMMPEEREHYIRSDSLVVNPTGEGQREVMVGPYWTPERKKIAAAAAIDAVTEEADGRRMLRHTDP